MGMEKGPSGHNNLASATTSPASRPGSSGPRQKPWPPLASVPLSRTKDRVRVSVARPAGTPHLAGKKLHQCCQICHRFLGISEEQALRSD